MMRWTYKHPTHGTCITTCHMYGVCHCGCGGPTKLATWQRGANMLGKPTVFIAHHFRPSQWRERRMATCHPDRPSHAQGLCKHCYWTKHKRAGRARKAVNDWERARFARFLVLTRSGLGRDEAMAQLERDVPSEFPEMETATA